MLAVNSYPQDHFDRCRHDMEAQVAAFRDLADTARGQAGAGSAAVDASIDAFEPLYFNSLVLALDSWFCHRSRTKELKDGNPLNEVRLLCSSITLNKGVLAPEKSIRYTPEASVLKLELGDPIALREADFVRLFEAFMADLERKFG